jgi:hypothetical protein
MPAPERSNDMRVLLAATIALVALAAPAPGADRQIWDFIESGGEARLSYGVPESDSLTIVFSCDAARRSIEVVTTIVPRKPRKGQPLRTTLRNGGVTTTYDGKIGHSDTEGYWFEVSAGFAPTVLDVVRSGTTLTIGIPGKQERVPLRGIADPLAKFETACFRKS